MSRCKKHFWHKIKVKHVFEANLNPGSFNYYFSEFKIKVCSRCHKVRNLKEKKA